MNKIIIDPKTHSVQYTFGSIHLALNAVCVCVRFCLSLLFEFDRWQMVFNWYSYVAICLATLCERRKCLRVFAVFINAADGRIKRRRPRTPIAFCGLIFMLFCKHNK